MTKQHFLIKTNEGTFKVKIWLDKSDKNGHVYLVKAVSLPGVTTFGRTLVEAKKMAKEALELYCEDVLDTNQIIIDDQRQVIGKLPKSHVIEVFR